MRLFRTMCYALLCPVAAGSMRADTLASQLPNSTFGNTHGNTAANYFGESFIACVAGGNFAVTCNGSYNAIAFSFLTPSDVPYATGTGFLLSQVYTGAPGALGSATAGFIGSANASGGLYSFGSSVVLTAGTQYYFYENSLIPVNTIGSGGLRLILQPDNSYAVNGGMFAAESSLNDAFQVTGNSVTTTPISVTPEPSSFALLGTGVLGVAGILRRRLLA